jgi:hypothetical protein
MKKILSILSVLMVLAWCCADTGEATGWDLGKCLEEELTPDPCYVKDKKWRQLIAQAKKGDGKPKYLAHNIWITNHEINQKCINYKTGLILPAGTEIRAAITLGNSIAFIAKDMEDLVSIKFTKNWHPRKTPKDYLEMMITGKPLPELTAGMSEIEMQGIKNGLIYEGMSKKAVLIAYGYPPEHKTPSLDQDNWMYWKNKFKRHRICFDENDRTTACGTQKVKQEKLLGKPL